VARKPPPEVAPATPGLRGGHAAPKVFFRVAARPPSFRGGREPPLRPPPEANQKEEPNNIIHEKINQIKETRIARHAKLSKSQ